MKEIETIYSWLEVGKYEIERIPEDYIVRKLLTNMLGHILDNRDKLPISITTTSNKPKREDPNLPITNYRLEMTIISKKELQRLEKDYNELMQFMKKDKEE